MKKRPEGAREAQLRLVQLRWMVKKRTIRDDKQQRLQAYASKSACVYSLGSRTGYARSVIGMVVMQGQAFSLVACRGGVRKRAIKA